MDSTSRRDKFAGSLIGTFTGDALGMPVEGWSPDRIARTFGSVDEFRSASIFLRVYSTIEGLLTDPEHSLSGVRLGRGTYTDDTQMMIAVAESLAECAGFDGADMARRFVDHFDPRRGYGPGAKQAITALRKGGVWNEVGSRVFNGAGSYGNGAAMRVAPVGALYYDEPEQLRNVAELASSITHAHPLGKEGGALQAYAVASAIRRDPKERLDRHAFLDELVAFVGPRFPELHEPLKEIRIFLESKPQIDEVVQVIGNEVAIHRSVPAAIYAFLSHPESFSECVVYAVGMGGDTDTIAAMAGAISGGFHGASSIPRDWWDALENGDRGRDYVVSLAERLADLAGTRNSGENQ